MKMSEKFIRAPQALCDFDRHVPAPYLRKTFTLDFEPARAEITICGLGFFELYLNGKRVSDDLFVPANSHYHAYDDCFCAREFGEEMASRVYALRYDLAPYLQNGENELTAVVAPGWYFRYGCCKLCVSGS